MIRLNKGILSILLFNNKFEPRIRRFMLRSKYMKSSKRKLLQKERRVINFIYYFFDFIYL